MEKKSIDWRIILVVCSLVVGTIMGIRNCFGLFLEPVSIYSQTGAEVFSLGMSIQALMWGLSAFFLGMIIDRFGPQKALAFGILCYAFGLYLLSDAHSFCNN